MTNTSRLEHCFTALKQQNRPALVRAALRALENGQTQAKTLEMVRQFREQNSTTPIVLMGYYNPIYCYGVERFLTDAAKAGVDGHRCQAPAQSAGQRFRVYLLRFRGGRDRRQCPHTRAAGKRRAPAARTHAATHCRRLWYSHRRTGCHHWPFQRRRGRGFCAGRLHRACQQR